MPTNVLHRWLTYLLFFPAILLAGPKLIVDTTEFRAGVIEEEKVTFIRHTFTVETNHPDKPKLIIRGALDVKKQP